MKHRDRNPPGEPHEPEQRIDGQDCERVRDFGGETRCEDEEEEAEDGEEGDEEEEVELGGRGGVNQMVIVPRDFCLRDEERSVGGGMFH